ncbi:MAG: ArsR family transcriptional regulator [Methanocellales archaeon]|nr:ArsR family transcriptional regulator [Methanocellales archaeon]MDD3291327.1 ArsR family transcriptional regulator [Methanocellales archaeon]MDD5235821.1 ArsR family transcriptional regulator [Methanocellales archaeon]MDD5484418.1 ArsR family transcriptional regulator [Methanocellales archaeon]
MPKRTRIVNDPADLVPLIQAFGSDLHKKVFNAFSSDWMTKEELEKAVGADVSESLKILQKGGLIQSRWRMPEDAGVPEKEFQASYSDVRANFQCGLDELSNLIRIASSDDEEFLEIVFKIEEEIKMGNTSTVGLCRALNQNACFIRGVAKRSNKLTVRGQKLLLAEEKPWIG